MCSGGSKTAGQLTYNCGICHSDVYLMMGCELVGHRAGVAAEEVAREHKIDGELLR